MPCILISKRERTFGLAGQERLKLSTETGIRLIQRAKNFARMNGSTSGATSISGLRSEPRAADGLMRDRLTRRRDPNSREEAWLIFYCGVHVGTIGMRSGNPTGGDHWSWHCGFYPGSKPGEATRSTAADFDEARAAFEGAWATFLAKRTEADFLEYRRHRASDAWKRTMWDAGCKLPTQVADGRSRCFCGAEIGIADMDQHICAAHMEPKAATAPMNRPC
jgi:hypothetical protein